MSYSIVIRPDSGRLSGQQVKQMLDRMPEQESKVIIEMGSESAQQVEDYLIELQRFDVPITRVVISVMNAPPLDWRRVDRMTKVYKAHDMAADLIRRHTDSYKDGIAPLHDFGIRGRS